MLNNANKQILDQCDQKLYDANFLTSQYNIDIVEHWTRLPTDYQLTTINDDLIYFQVVVHSIFEFQDTFDCQ